MSAPDVIIIGGGISGLAFAYRAAKSGKNVLILESTDRVGGCIHSVRRSDGYWFELGAHTTYNSYVGFLEIAEATGALNKLIERGPARKCFGLLRNGNFKWLTPPKVLLELNWLEVALHFPRGIFRSKQGQTIRSYYSGLLGHLNFDRVLSPFLAAVPSQNADDFPVQGPGSLFKKRPRRKELPRSYGFDGGLQTVCDGVEKLPNVRIRRGVAVRKIEQMGRAFRVETVEGADGERFEAPIVVIATPHDRAQELLTDSFPRFRDALARLKVVEIESFGFTVPREKVKLPPAAFLVPVNDMFFSAVTRDPFPDPQKRAFTFHFHGGLLHEHKLRRIMEVLTLNPEDFGEVIGKRVRLPSPTLGHAEIVAELDRQLSSVPGLSLTGNYFAGMAIEDCVQRSFSEWDRLARQ